MAETEQLPEANLPALKAPVDMSTGMTTTGGLVPTNLDQLWQLSTIMHKSGMMPKGIQTTEAVCIAVQMGLEVGLSPMQAVQNIAVINGTPSLWGDSVLGLVRASGLLEDFDEYFELSGKRLERNEVEVSEYPNELKAVCFAKRVGQSAPTLTAFSVEDAKVATLWVYPAKGLTPWHKYPKRMLQMRARSWCLRDGFGDIIKGLHVAEEVIDMVPTAQEKAKDLTEEIKGGATTENPVVYKVEDTEKENPEDLGPGGSHSATDGDPGETEETNEGLLAYIEKCKKTTMEKSIDTWVASPDIKVQAAAMKRYKHLFGEHYTPPTPEQKEEINVDNFPKDPPPEVRKEATNRRMGYLSEMTRYKEELGDTLYGAVLSNSGGVHDKNHVADIAEAEQGILAAMSTKLDEINAGS